MVALKTCGIAAVISLAVSLIGIEQASASFIEVDFQSDSINRQGSLFLDFDGPRASTALYSYFARSLETGDIDQGSNQATILSVTRGITGAIGQSFGDLAVYIDAGTAVRLTLTRSTNNPGNAITYFAAGSFGGFPSFVGFANASDDIFVGAVPLPSTLPLFAAGLLGLGVATTVVSRRPAKAG